MPDNIAALKKDGSAAALAALKGEMVTGYRAMAREGLGLGYLGHLTARLPGGTTFWSYPWGLSFEEVEEPDLQECDFQAKNLTSDLAINPVLAVHGQIYTKRPEVISIAHHHGPNVVALGILGRVLEPIHIVAARHFNDIGFLREDGHRGAVDQGDATLAALGSKRAVIQQNHGIMVTGSSVADTVVATLEIEYFAGIQLKAMAAGELKLMPADEIPSMTTYVRAEKTINDTWAYLKRAIARERQQ
jgi:L-fuculose-phosphate aldolase